MLLAMRRDIGNVTTKLNLEDVRGALGMPIGTNVEELLKKLAAAAARKQPAPAPSETTLPNNEGSQDSSDRPGGS
jgi:hypothetical protein